jgi:hypothetical protein
MKENLIFGLMSNTPNMSVGIGGKIETDGAEKLLGQNAINMFTESLG